MKTIRVGVTGGRDYLDIDKIYHSLNEAHRCCTQLGNQMLLVVGDCPTGLDHTATKWAKENQDKVNHIVFKANWDLYGKAAGPKRNTRMIEFKINILLSFPGGKGTLDMTTQALNASIPVKYVK